MGVVELAASLTVEANSSSKHLYKHYFLRAFSAVEIIVRWRIFRAEIRLKTGLT